MAEEQKLELKDQLKNILEEARMVLPGIQALFGFQLIAVINEAFSKKLDAPEQRIHLLALTFTAVAAGLCLAPAAVHRVAEPDRVTTELVKSSTSFLNWGMKALGLGLVLDFYIVCRVILHDSMIALSLAAGFFLFLFVLWIVVPRWVAHQRHEADRGGSGARYTDPRSSKT